MKNQFWNFYAKFYDVLATFPPYIAVQDKVVEYLELIFNLELLDVGCGTGNTVQKLASLSDQYLGMEIVAIDTSPSMLARARKKLKGATNVAFEERNFNDLTGLNSPDRIVAVHTLYTSSDVFKTLQSWRELLADGGLLIIVNPVVPRQLYFQEFFRNIWEKKDVGSFLGFIRHWPRWGLLFLVNRRVAKKAENKNFQFLQPQELQTLAESAGFKMLCQEMVYGGSSVIMSLQKVTEALVRRAQRPEEIAEVDGIRYNIYCHEIFSIPPDQCHQNKETDEFDMNGSAVYFIAKKNKRIVACLRILFLVKKEPLFLMEKGGVIIPTDLERAKTVEFTRWIVIKEERGTGLWLALAKTAVAWCRAHGYYNFIMMANEKLWLGVKKQNWPLQLWAPYELYHGTISAPGQFFPPSIL